MHNGNERGEQAPVFFRISVRVPITDVLLVPQRVVMNPAAKVIHHPFDVAQERCNLVGSFGRPKNGIDTVIVVVKAAWLRRDYVRRNS